MVNFLVRQAAVARSLLTSSAGLWRGTLVLKAAKQPPRPLVLYEFEATPACRAVREVLTALHLDAQIRPCPEGGKRYRPKVRQLSGSDQLPVLIDQNADRVMTNAADIVAYLFRQYGEMEVPMGYSPRLTMPLGDALSSSLRLGRGWQVRASRKPKKTLDLWSFESSPYSRLVRERLSELQLPYTLHNLGKEHWDELGPAARRLRPGHYLPTEGGKRHAFWLKHQRVQVPYLEDPNQDVTLFESAKIVDYLEEQYAI